MLERKEHRFEVGDRVYWRICCSERWPIVILKQTRLFGWIPSYTVGMEIDEIVIPGVLDVQLRR